jgi:hypothetical protein
MFLFDIISKIDLSIIVGIVVLHNFNRDVINVFTSPSSITGVDGEWTFTGNMTVFWTVNVHSPSTPVMELGLVKTFITSLLKLCNTTIPTMMDKSILEMMSNKNI